MLDGTFTQPSIEVEGGGLFKSFRTVFSNGLTIEAGDTEIRGLVIVNFNNNGILIRGNGGNIIGIDSTGMVAQGNANDGVQIFQSPNNTIGGTTPDKRNVISGNAGGIRIAGSLARGNKVKGNFIGTDKNGECVLDTNGRCPWVTRSWE